jgi:protein-histidine pros-kinase
MSTLRPDIQEINAWLEAIVAASSDAIVSYTVDGTILTWNPAAERMFGYTAEEAVGQRVSLIVPPECAQEPCQLFGRLQAGHALRDLQTIRMRKDGARIPVRIDLAPIKTADGMVTGISATLCDLAERTRAEERFRGLLDSAPDPILGVDRAGQIVFANPQTEKVFGYTPAELLGASIEVLVPDRLRDGHHRLRAEYLVAPTTRPMGAGLDLRARRRDGTEFPVEISLSPLAEPDGTVIVAIVRDITERALAEEERARERAEIGRLKDDLSNMIVHDLKNPVNGIAMTVQVMLRRAGELSERQRRSLLGIELTCREMLRLTQNLLEIAKIEAGKMPIERQAVDLAAVVRQVAAEYGQVAEQVGRRLVVAVGSDLPFATADAALLKRVLVNLVVNAIRHSGASEVRVEATPLPGLGELTVRVVDDGQGIPAADQARIFEKFASVRRTPSGEPSADTGLGLPFCKLAVERMGGSIALTSAPGGPTVFAVTLPIHGQAM